MHSKIKQLCILPHLYLCSSYKSQMGTEVAQWLRCCATNRFDPSWWQWIFHWHNPSDRTMALGSTQPLTEMSTRSISWGKMRAVR